MKYLFKLTPLLLLGGWLLTACSNTSQQPKAIVKGKITVDSTVDSSGDFSDIAVTITHKDSAGAQSDTLFHALTDSLGNFQGTAHFNDRGVYPMHITRYGNRIANSALVLADQDTITITGELPDFNKNHTIKSHENTAMDELNRVQRSFNRVALYIQAGKIKGDSLKMELDKWSNLFWSVYQDNKNTLAGRQAIVQSLNLLQSWNGPKMMKRIRAVQDQDDFADIAARYGTDYLSKSKGLEPTLHYLDSLQTITDDNDQSMRIAMEKIKLLYDSARVKTAANQLASFKKTYANQKAAKQWAQTIGFDLANLAPGDSIPNFSFTTLKGQTIARDSLLGHPYILEISYLSNDLYKEQFDRTLAIYYIYKNFGLNVVTIPLDDSQVTINAFFDERAKPWPVAKADAFDKQKLLKRFNVTNVPTRFLVNSQGRIVRKYVGPEFDDVIRGLRKVIKQTKESS